MDCDCVRGLTVNGKQGAKETSGQGSGKEGSAHTYKGQSVFVNFDQLLLLFLPGAGIHPGFTVEVLHCCLSCYSHL